DIGGRTSHSAILARTLEIPAVVGTKKAMESVANGSLIIVDGLEGSVIIEPDDETVKRYEAKQAAFRTQKEIWAKLKNEPTVTSDGVSVELAANIGSPKDAAGAVENGAEAVG